MTSTPAVVARQVTRQFISRSGETVTALDRIDLVIPRGVLVAIQGPSGCGKSTLLNLVGLLDRPSEGHLRVDDIALEDLDVTQAAHFRRGHVGFLFQDAGLIEPMTVADNVALPLIYQGIPRSERGPRVSSALRRVGLANREDSAVAELSGGERQRVGLARAVIAAPAMLICDEPTAALDEANSLAVIELLREQTSSGRTVICSSHDPILASHADFVVFLRHGRIEAAHQR